MEGKYRENLSGGRENRSIERGVDESGAVNIRNDMLRTHRGNEYYCRLMILTFLKA